MSLLLAIFLKFISSQKGKHGSYLAQNCWFFISKTFNFCSIKKRCEVFFENSSCWISHFAQVNVFTVCHLSKIYLQTKGKAWLYLAQNLQCFILRIFKKFCLLFRNNCLREHLWVAASVYSNSYVLQGSTYFLGKYYSRKYLNVKITHS